MPPEPQADQQADFAASVLDVARPIPNAVTSYSTPHPVQRFAIYRNNVYAGLTGTLRSRFPVVARLVGDEFFAAASRMFVEAHPPASPVLITYGAEFPRFLTNFEAAADVPYLPDVARFEWLQAEAYHSADAEPLSAEALAALPFNEAEHLVLDPHPAVRVLASPYPVFSIWRTNTHDEDVTPIDASAGGEAVLITRPHLDVELRKIPHGLAALVTAISAQTPLLAAAQQALTTDPAFNLEHGLAALIETGAITGFHTAPPSQHLEP